MGYIVARVTYKPLIKQAKVVSGNDLVLGGIREVMTPGQLAAFENN